MNKVMDKISQGVYVLTTFAGGCIVDSVSQVSSEENPLLTISVRKENYTNELVHENNKIILSVLGKDVDGRIIETFGFHSMRDYNKFENIDTMDVDGIKVPLDSLGYIELEIEERIENNTHTLLLCRYQNSRELNVGEELTYNEYRRNKTKNKKEGSTWVCTACGYIYEGKNIPDDFICPICGADKSMFEKK